MKILQATTARGWSGGTEQCFLLAKYMNQEGHVTHILTYPGTELDVRAKESGITTLYFPNVRRLSVSEAWKLAEIIKGYDVVNTHIPKAHWFVWLASFAIRRRPVIVYTRRVPYSISLISRFTKYRFRTDLIIAVSPQIKDIIGGRGLSGKMVRYIPSGIELQRFDPSMKSYVRKELGISEDTLVVVNVGNFSDVKGHLELLPAFKEFLGRCRRQACLLLAGRDTDSKIVEAMVNSLGIDRSIRLLGFRRDIPQVIGAGDIFVFPSKKEGIAGTLLQAMAMEKLVVSTDVGGIKEYLRDGINGIVIKPERKSILRGLLDALSLDDRKKEKMTSMAREAALRYDIKKVVRETLLAYQEVLKRKSDKHYN